MLLFAFCRTTAQDNFKILYPEYIPLKANFEITLITSKKFSDAQKLNIFISSDLSLIINKVELVINEEIIRIPLRSEFVEKYSEQFKKFSIDLSDSERFSTGVYFQLVISLKSSKPNLNEFKFFGEYLRDDKILGYLQSTNEKIITDEEYLYELSFDYYKPYWTAGTALSLVQGSYFNIPIKYDIEQVGLLEFWMKVKNPTLTFLQILNKETNRIEYEFSINENQMLIVNSLNEELLPVNPFFISENAWYHFNLKFEKGKSEFSLIFDGDELTNFKIKNGMDFENLVLHFQNGRQQTELIIDQLRLISLKSDYIDLNRNKNYSDYSDKNSDLILQINFDDSELNELVNSHSISYEGIKLVKSNAPIFPRSPEINVKFSDNFYEVEWEGGSYKDAAKYILERSIGSNDFIVVGQQIANNTNTGRYTLLSEKVDQPEIIYFRIKQVNNDGSVVYSDVVKVGQGNIDDVIIGQNFPNPFNPTTLIEFELVQDSEVEVKVYNLAGKEISQLHKGFLSKGVHQFTFDAQGFPSGVYLYQITTPFSSQTRKMILAK